MVLKLTLSIPDIYSGNIGNKIFYLKEDDYKEKSIKQVIINNAFKEVLVGQDSESAEQALQLIFTLIRPVGILEKDEWWDKPFSTLVDENKQQIDLKMEFSEEGLEFINEMM
ncbi:MAG: hypothetical protein ACFFDW_13280 [Candidatus Thorarchaeota archaeon]